MKLLFDENMPFSLANRLLSHDRSSATCLGWSGTKNGELLRRAEENGFDVLLTLDDNIPSEQNMTGRRISILILKPASQGKASVVTRRGVHRLTRTRDYRSSRA
ncbi:MAG: DUF5615 family PIN-like protein [Armatimonadetes bacterium]|nr:DUF5615 family PIN-like protein [Armatimonadota bacterium]